MSPEDLDAVGLSSFATLTDEEALELVDEIEAILLKAAGTPGDQGEMLTRARLAGFVYGYKLGLRPKDTQPERAL